MVNIHGKKHTETLEVFITKLGQYPIVLGIPWLWKHDPHIQFMANTMTFDSEHCLKHCLTTHQAMTVSDADILFGTLPHRRYAPQMTHRIEMADRDLPLSTVVRKNIMTTPLGELSFCWPIAGKPQGHDAQSSNHSVEFLE